MSLKVLFVYPRFVKCYESFPEESFDGAERLDGYACSPGLAISALAAATLAKHECRCVDQNLTDIDYDADVDVVAVTCFTPQAFCRL